MVMVNPVSMMEHVKCVVLILSVMNPKHRFDWLHRSLHVVKVVGLATDVVNTLSVSSLWSK